MKPLVTRSERKVTYAAVAANISTRLAVVKMARHIENRAEYARSTPSRSSMFFTKYSVNIEAAGIREAKTTPTRWETARRCDLR